MGQEFTPTLDEKNIVIEARRIPSTSLSQSQEMQFDIENLLTQFPQVAFVFARTGTPDMAADPMPPNATDTYVILKPQDEWPDPKLTKAELIKQIEAEAAKLVGHVIGFSQPIQMRFNELIAGVREDLAVKVFGEEFEPMLRIANQIADISRGLKARPTSRSRRRGAAVPGDQDQQGRDRPPRSEPLRRAGRRSARRSAGAWPGWCSRATGAFRSSCGCPMTLRSDIEALKDLPVPSAGPRPGRAAPTIPLRQLASFEFAEGPNQISRENGKRRVVVTAKCAAGISARW